MMATQQSAALKNLTAGFAEVGGDIQVTGLTLDSRSVAPGDLFLAMPGGAHDGRDYIGKALAAGAAAVLGEQPLPADSLDTARVIAVKALSRYAGTIADRFYDQPSRHLCVVGITGTNGKTTCSHLMAQALEFLGTPSGVLGTVGYGRLSDLKSSALTTADVISVHRQLYELLEAGAHSVCMEVSSHALDQGRVDKVAFDLAMFTNLSQDHLDYHDDMASYGAAKARLFHQADLTACVINVDDSFGRYLAGQVEDRLLWSYGRSEDARLRLLGAEPESGGQTIEIEFEKIRSRTFVPLAGDFNADNVTAVIAALLALGFPRRRVEAAMASLKPVAGRMETITQAGKPVVVIDYAHTPDALEKVLHACRGSSAGELWLVFGCGGDRDREKRPQMGAIAEQHADRIIVTNDNPRGEDPGAIAGDILAGMSEPAEVCLDRADAIASAIGRAAPDDIVLVAGKGHETGQIVADQVLPFNDREVVGRLLGGGL